MARFRQEGYLYGNKVARDKFDKVSQILKPRYEDDQDVTHHNLLISEYKTSLTGYI